MGIQINGQTDVISAADGSLTVSGADLTSAINFSVSGVGTITDLRATNANITGVGTIATLIVTGNASIGGTVTYMDVTNVDSVGIITAQVGLQVLANGINVTGVSTLSGGVNASQGVDATGLRVTGITTLGQTNITGLSNAGVSTLGNATASTLVVSGVSTLGAASATLLNVSGVVTATSFSGDGSGLTGVGIGSTGNISTTGNINAGIATFTRLDVPPVPITFSPGIGVTNVNVDSNIIITFNQLITKGTGNITLRSGSAGGTAFSTIGVSSSSVTISGGAVTIDPPSNIGTGVTTFVVVDAGAFSGITTTSTNAIINTYSFTTANLILSSINPANGATNVGVDTNITLTLNQPPTRGTGTITLRSGSTSGSVIESFDAASSVRISISGNNYIIDPTSNLGFSTSIHTIIPSTAIVGYVGLNTTGADTHSFTTVALNLGDSYEGGFLICKASPLRWVVSPYSAEVSRNWYNRNDANTRAQQVSGCTGWFVPTKPQLQNPGYCCRSFWGPSPCYSSATYWSSTECNASNACFVHFNNGNADFHTKTASFCVRAFRCVTY